MRAVIVGLIIVLTAFPANSNTDIYPGRKKSSLVVEATDEVRPSLRARAPVRANSSKELPKFLRCDLSDSGSSCGDSFSTLPGDPDEPELTEGDILRAVREIGLPSLKVQIQPGEETLVNIETIFYAEPKPFERSIDLLGFDIDLIATPVRFHWVHDDGTVATTSRPGRPYPAMDVTHRYREPADDVHPRVDVTYQVRYRVDGEAWRTLGQTLRASGPAAALDVREAAPVLSKP
jgi:hypothetical protein